MSIISNDVFLAQALKSMSYVVVTNAESKIVYIDQKYAKILGVEVEDCLGVDVIDIIPNSGIPYVAATKSAEMGQLFKMKNGETVVVNRFPIIENGRFLGVVTTASFNRLDSVRELQMEIEKLQATNAIYKNKVLEMNSDFTIERIIGESPQMREIKSSVLQFANSDLPVLITGETGTGKEVVADAIHKLSPRSKEAFVKINCAAIPKDLLESELFGYEPGSFSGARKEGKIGKFELANHGTLLLDEIGEMPLTLQVKLLRVLQEREIERVGGTKPIPINARILCTTNKLLFEAMESGLFRRDLYYRINTVEIHMPPLRERIGDIMLLSNYFFRSIASHHGLGVEGISQEARDLLNQYDWPGNVRELRNVLERACFVADTGHIERKDLEFLSSRIKMRPTELTGEDLHSSLETLERRSIIEALKTARGNKSAAAKIINVDRAVLYRRMEKYKIRGEDYEV